MTISPSSPVARTTLALLAFSMAGCSFILDFDKLQSGKPGLDAGPGVTPGPGGLVDGGPIDDGSCDRSCDDNDPCTTDLCRKGQCRNEIKRCSSADVCMSSECIDGECKETPIVGVFPDGYDEVILADEILRGELVGAGDRFFQATFGTFDAKRDISLATFDANSSEPLAKTRFTSLPFNDAVEIASPVSLVPDSRLGKTLNAYFAGLRSGQGSADLLRVSFNRDLAAQPGDAVLTATPNFPVSQEQLGPSGSQLLTGDAFVAWAGEGVNSDGVYIQRGEEMTNRPLANFPAASAVSGISAIRADDTPGAVWMTDQAEGIGLDVALQGVGQVIALAQCHSEPDYQGYHLDVSQSIADIWTVTWTKRNGDDFITEISSLQCQATGCTDLANVGAGESCSAAQIQSRVIPNVRALLTRTMRKQGDPDNVIYQAVVVAAQDPNGGVGRLNLLLNRIEYDLANDTQDDPEQIASVTLDTDMLENAASRPSLALLPPNSIAVSWIKQQQNGQGDELHVQRHRICFDE